MTALHRAAKGGHDACVALLVEQGCDVNSCCRDGGFFRSPLYLASESGSCEAVRTLVATEGIQLNGNHGKFGPPLSGAVCCGHLEIVKLLISSGAQIEWPTYPTGLPSAAVAIRSELMLTPIHRAQADRMLCAASGTEHAAELACRSGQAEVLEYLLADVPRFSLDIDQLLEVAAHQKDMRCMEVLFRQGAVETPHLSAIAVSNEHVELLRLLLERGLAQKTREYCLGLAAAQGSPQIVQFLVDHGADPNSAGYFWGSALHCAAAGANLQCISILIQAGADVGAIFRNQTAAGLSRSMATACKGEERDRRLGIAEYLEEAARGENVSGAH